MMPEDILVELEKLSENSEIRRSQIMEILKKYARIISVQDLMLATAYIRKDGEYIQEQYREKYLEIYIKYFIIRMNEVKLLKRTFETERMSNAKDDKFPLIYVITALYTTFILEEPIHPVGSEFPGNLSVEEIDGEYFCPVKDNQKDNPNAICHLCLAEQTPDI